MTLISSPTDRRHGYRIPISRLPGELLIKNDGTPIEYKPLNISSHGLGILSSKALGSNAEILLKIGDLEIAFEIVWGIKDWSMRSKDAFNKSGKSAAFRYGLKTKTTDDLIIVLKKKGYLKKVKVAKKAKIPTLINAFLGVVSLIPLLS